MKKIKVSEANGDALDWMVCIAEGLKPEDIYISHMGRKHTTLFRRLRDEGGALDGRYITGPDLLFSRKWEAGGPIIDGAEIDTYLLERGSPLGYIAEITGTKFKGRGPTRLIAAMRCYVASKLGEEVEVPDELL